MPLLENRVAGLHVLLTGGSSGIGRAIAEKLVTAGARVAITGRDRARLEQTNRLCGNQLLIYVCDGARDLEVNKTVLSVEQEFGRVDVLINNAGINVKERYARNLTPENWRLTIEANLGAAFYFIRAVLPGMLARKDGQIINISSVSGLRANKLGGTAYAASKFGLMALTQSLALEEAENGIRTTAICPGEVDTPILEQRPMPVTAERRAVILRPEDVAEAVYFVANLRPGVSVPELIITPMVHPFA